MKTQKIKTSVSGLLLITLFIGIFTNCGRINYKYYGTVYSKNNYPVPNAKLVFTFMIGSKETNTDTRTTETDNNGYYEINFSEPRQGSLHVFTVISDSSVYRDYRSQQPTNNRKSDIYLQ